MAADGASVKFDDTTAEEGGTESRVIGLRNSRNRDKRVSRFRSRKASRKLEKNNKIKKKGFLSGAARKEGDLEEGELPPKKPFVPVEGYLTKLGANVKNWKKRWVILEDYCMTYYKSEDGRGERGSISLEDVNRIEDICTIERREVVEREEKNAVGKEHLFLLFTNNRVWYFVADTEQSKKDWVAAIKEQLVELQEWRIDHRGNPRQYKFLPKDVREVVEKSKISPKNMKHADLQVLTNAIRFLKVSRLVNYTQHRCSNPSYLQYSIQEEDSLIIKDVNPNSIYRIRSMIGRGGFGCVFEAIVIDQNRQQQEGVQVAVKKMPHRTEDDKQNNLNELRFIAQAKHKNIVRYFGAYLWRDELWIVLEMMEGGALTKAISDYNLQEKHIAFICRSVLLALESLHKIHICHRDLKSENIMFTKEGEVKLIDFGLAETIKDGWVIDVLGSPFWIAPEMIQLKPHGPPVDIWAFAISILEVINGHPPHEENALCALYYTGTVGVPKPIERPSEWSKEIADFVGQALTRDPKARPTATDLLKHNFLNCACTQEEMKEKILKGMGGYI
uniref:Non-specific serine/threonine protein kinase n=1 Tax=Paramoeba aestuarina TaxID=180227 RepID=A0A7S4P4D8_9EUKA|mmetsp:Transcript_36099/g.56524  ORF Transcript_36099/g.56524 Transcript_36099/m.56524 type:complete len:560 (+) Transcript_36099:124-1803(+)|eukprot:CAMPEP_0201524804 /NCGR_PEP_ID=MMETSP0161_2-20130828/25359_1 /ASSEMBLY_ACC=CAM_ASM_000251 /TAXON_ID=180227 /ORGANISM="Neoparamoeba aestuarina, Strain SoJaBio B1-5/56/2" /LENGTH=559 /DNA_ID=CAMNT_0047924395 /DNA_START=35 /DNA_END=1714 /DNA_ORIENTATION=-